MSRYFSTRPASHGNDSLDCVTAMYSPFAKLPGITGAMTKPLAKELDKRQNPWLGYDRLPGETRVAKANPEIQPRMRVVCQITAIIRTATSHGHPAFCLATWLMVAY